MYGFWLLLKAVLWLIHDIVVQFFFIRSLSERSLMCNNTTSVFLKILCTCSLSSTFKEDAKCIKLYITWCQKLLFSTRSRYLVSLFQNKKEQQSFFNLCYWLSLLTEVFFLFHVNENRKIECVLYQSIEFQLQVTIYFFFVKLALRTNSKRLHIVSCVQLLLWYINIQTTG